jgi:diacylglycerol kinase family enzyme
VTKPPTDPPADPQRPQPPAAQRAPGPQAPDRPLRTAVVVNPVRVPDLASRREVVDRALAEAGWPPATWLETTAEDPGIGQTRQVVRDGAEVVFVCGGDGTVRACIEGLVLAGEDAREHGEHREHGEAGDRDPAQEGPALAVLPAGTGNLLASNLGLPDDPAEGVRLAVERGRRRLDVGELAPDPDARGEGLAGGMFAVMAGMGFDAHLLRDADEGLKARIGPAAYVLSAVRHLRDRPMHVEIRVDDEPPVRRTARSVLVGNVGRLQGGLRLLPDAEPDSGTFDVAVLAPRTLVAWAALAVGVLLRRREVATRQLLRGRHIVVTSDRPEPREMDGDVLPSGRRLDVRIRPGALWLCVYQPDTTPDLAEGSP